MPLVFEYGYCQCGCGNKTTVAPENVRTRGYVKGEPRRYLSGHGSRILPPPIEEALPFKIDDVYCRLLPLDKGLYAIIDESDYEYLMQWRWTSRWCPKSKGFYAVRNIQINGKRKHRSLASEVMRVEHGIIVDHANRVTLDNRRKNLRVVTHTENMWNRKQTVRKYPYPRGVYKVKNIFQATIRQKGKFINLGSFSDPESAGNAYREAVVRLRGKEFL